MSGAPDNTAPRPGLQLLDWKPLSNRKGALVGIASIKLPNGLAIHKVMLFAQGERRWASLPAEPMIGRDGVAMTDAAGKRRYVSLLSWPDKAVADRFSAAVIAAIEAAHPGATSGEETPA